MLRLLVAATMVQFLLNAIAELIDGFWMACTWVTGGLVVAMATVRIEKYLQRHRKHP